MLSKLKLKIDKGIELIEDSPGQGIKAEKGARLVYNTRFFLRRGEEVTGDFRSIARNPEQFKTRQIDGVTLIDHSTVLGKRQLIAAVEKALYGMQAGGFREIVASSHLCYGKQGVAGLIPPDAMLRVQLWVQEVHASG
ncbi:MAG: FKBP-type peptidyl-prolyl cis-trans isomerase [Gammaproteobacteria bacterium]|nr:FKBP-type peptidyl-prolyl cis-trans isomerase [Gammaproteobacteria bacterium]